MEESQVLTLKDGSQVKLRRLVEKDYDKSFQFFQDLSDEDRLYLRLDVTDPEVVRARMKTNPRENVFRLIVEHEDKIVADATLRWPHAGWMSHIGEVRIIIANDLRRKGLAAILYRKIFIQAVKEGLEKVEGHMTPQQESARKCMEKLGFREQGVLKGFVKDLSGNLQDLVIMSANVGGF